MTNRNDCRGNLVLVLAVLVALAGFRSGLAEDQNQKDNLVGYEATDRLGRQAFIRVPRGAIDEELPAPEEIEQIRKAAEAGDASAQFTLALKYNKGEGVPEDHQEAVKWYRLAAEQGLAEAQFNLGWMYAAGKGVLEDYKQSVKWLSKAANQGDAKAQYGLGDMHYRGWGVPEDYVKAYAWFILAAAQGEENAVKAKELLRSRMTAAQVAEAQQVASSLFKRIESSKSQ